ncbi:unnamed protein product, partial [Closterium sp. NIES-53]
DNLYIGQLEEKMTHIRMGKLESATDYCNRARRILAEMRMAGAEYSTTSYISHIVKSLPRGYNLMKRMMMVPGTRESLDKDSITSYILQDEAMQEAEQPTELLPQANYAAPTKLNQQQGQRRKPGGGGSGGGQSTKDVDEKRLTRDKGRGGGDRRRECWICHDRDHLSYECPDRDESDEDDTKGGRDRSTSRRPRRDAKPSKEKQTLKKTSPAKDVDNSSGKSRGDGEASCSMVGVVEPTVSLAPEAGEDFQTVAAAVQANPMAALLDSSCSPPDGDEGDLRRHGAEQRREAREPAICWPGEGERSAAAGRRRRDAARRCNRGGARSSTLQRMSPLHRPSPLLDAIVVDRGGGSTDKCLDDEEMRTPVESVRTMLLHMGVQHHWWHLALQQAVWVRYYLERLTTPPGTTPCQLLTEKKPDLTLARVWGCMVRFMVPEQQRGGKLAPKARWGIHLGVLPESKGWEVLDLTDNKVVMSVEVIFYETLSLEVWKAKFGPASGWTQAHPPTDTSTATAPLLAEVNEPADEDFVEVLPPSPVLAPPFAVADRPASTPVSAIGDEGSLEASPVAPASGIAGGRQGAKLVDQDRKPSMTGELQTGEPVEQEAAAGVQSTGELSKSARGEQLVEGSKQLVDELTVDEEGELSAGEESTDSDVVEVPIMKLELRHTSRARRPPERLSFHACLPPAAFTTVYDEVDDDLLYDDAEEDEELSELEPDVHAGPEHHWDIATMTVKEAMASWKGEAVKAAMEEEIRSLIGMGTWDLVQRPRGGNIMKSRWVLTTKYCIDDTVEREKARLVVKGFTQMYGADYDETYLLVSTYVTLRIFLSIVAVLDLNLMQLDMKNAFLQSKLDRVLYMYQPDYFDEGTGRVGDNGVTCWVLVYVDDLLAASSSPAMLKELKELLEAAFELREISLVVKRFINEERGGRVLKTPVSVEAYAELTFNEEEAQEHKEEEYRQNVGSLQIAATTTTRPDIAFACSKLGNGLTVRSNQHCHEDDHCLAYLADTRDTALEFGDGPESLELIGYVDANDADVKQNMGGYVFVYTGAAVSWSSSRIKCTTLSLTESEYVAATDACKEGCRLRFLLAEIKLLDAGKPTILRVDNKSAITVGEGLGLTGNLKHMERRYAWLQHMVRCGKFVLKYIPTTEQPTDFLTKALHFLAFNRCSVAIGQVRLADVGDGDDDVQQ